MASVRTAAAVVLFFGFAACVTKTGTTPRAIPPWVTATPPPSSGYTYFVGSGSDAQGNIAAANENAVHSLTSDVTRYLGVTITSETTVETRADLKSFETRVAESIRESSSATVGDFQVVDRWIRRNGNQVTVFLLGKYQTAALLAEKSRLAALERERTDAVAVPEKQGDSLISEGKPYDAAVKFMQAALAATEPQIANSSVRFERNMSKAGEAVSKIKLLVVTEKLTGVLGRPFSGPLVIEAKASTDGKEAPAVNLPFVVSYPLLRSNGRPGTGTMHLVSDAHGRVTITLPPPQLVGRQEVTVALDMAPQLEPLLRASEPPRTLVSSLEHQINAVRVVLSYSAVSQASSIPTGVLVSDLDRGGSQIPEDDTAAGIVNALTQAGFDILPIPSSQSVAQEDDSQLLKMLRSQYGDKITRAVIGRARIAGFDQSEGTYIVKVSGQVAVVDLGTGTILFSTTQVKLSRASEASSAISAAFKGLGVSIGDEIRNRLY